MFGTTEGTATGLTSPQTQDANAQREGRSNPAAAGDQPNQGKARVPRVVDDAPLRHSRRCHIFDLVDADIVMTVVDGDIAWITYALPGGTEAVIKTFISEIEWRNK